LCVGVALDVLEETASGEDDEGFKWTTPVQGLIANIPSQLLGHRPQSK
jgi:hypothetical protein